MHLFSTVLTLVLLSSPVFGDRKKVMDSLRKTYNNQTETSDLCLYLANMEEKKNPCHIISQSSPELIRIGLKFIDIHSVILTGDFNDVKGYRVVLDDSTTVDVPVILKCIPKYKNGNAVTIKFKEYLFYLVVYRGYDDGLHSERVQPLAKTEDDKPVLILSKAKIINDILKVYSTKNQERTRIKVWFDRAENKSLGLQTCESVSVIGQTVNEARSELEIINGTIEIKKPFFLLVTESIRVKLYGIIICDVKYTKKSENEGIDETKRKYYAVTNREAKRGAYVVIYGPKIINNDTIIFALNPELLSTP